MRSLSALLVVLLLLPGALFAATGDVTQSSSFVGYVPDRVVITLRAGVDIDPQKSADSVQLGIPALDRLAGRFAVHNVEALHPAIASLPDKSAVAEVLSRVYAVDLPAGADIHAVKAAYEGLPEVEEVRLVEIMLQSAYLPDDPALSSQWYLRNMSPGGGDVRAVGGWNQALGDTNIIVAVCDSGVDWHHPDLGGSHPDKVNGAVWTNWAEYYGTPGVDDDGNNYMDDIRGWDFVNISQGAGWPDEDMTVADNDPMDYESHGTAVAGCVAAITNNGVGISGTAPGCKVMALRCGYLPAGSTLGVVRMDYVSQGFIYAVVKGASVVNLSAGSSSFLTNALNYCRNNDVLVVTAAGNDGSDDSSGSWLSTQAGVVSVAATDPNDAKASFSNFGPWITLAAPGTSIYTTHYDRVADESIYASTQGTSFASPIAAGVAAMIRSANPGLSYTQTINAMTAACDNVDDENPLYAGQLGAGRINMLKALGDNMHRYPEEFPTLFDAMNNSAEGDTVGVTGGTIIPGPLTVLDGVKFFGGYETDYSSRDALGNPSILQGTSSNTVLRFHSGVETDTEVDGFQVEGGGGTSTSGVPFAGDFGGGITVNNVSPTLRNLLVTGNDVGDGSTLGGGGGVFINGSSAVLENVTVTGNSAVLGAGVYVNNSSPTLIGCLIDNNTMVTDNLGQEPLGGGLYALDSDVTMIDCVVSNHTGCESGGGVYVDGFSGTSDLTMSGGTVSGNDANVKGGGVFFNSGALDMKGVRLEGNLKGAAPNFMSGGGLYAGLGTATVDSIVCTGNTSQLGAAVTFENSTTAAISNSVLFGNVADFYGGGLVVQGIATATVAGNTIAENQSPTAGGTGIYIATSDVGIDNNIIAFNTGGTTFANGVHLASGTATFACNDVFGHDVDFAGVADPTGTAGNISLDPEFCTEVGNYNVKDTSPCDPDNSGGCGLIGALGDGCGIVSNVGGDQDEGTVPMVFRVEQNYPNPFNPITRIRFSLPEKAHTEVAIFDIKGRRVRTLVSENLEAKSHEIEWAGRDESGRVVAAGVYFYMVSSGEHRSVGRMALVK